MLLSMDGDGDGDGDEVDDKLPLLLMLCMKRLFCTIGGAGDGVLLAEGVLLLLLVTIEAAKVVVWLS